MQRDLTEVLFIIKESLGKNTEDHKIPKRGQNPKRAKSPTEKEKGKLKWRAGKRTENRESIIMSYARLSLGQRTNVAHQRLNTEHRQKPGLNTWLHWSCDRKNKTQVTGVIGNARKQKILK